MSKKIKIKNGSQGFGAQEIKTFPKYRNQDLLDTDLSKVGNLKRGFDFMGNKPMSQIEKEQLKEDNKILVSLMQVFTFKGKKVFECENIDPKTKTNNPWRKQKQRHLKKSPALICRWVVQNNDHITDQCLKTIKILLADEITEILNPTIKKFSDRFTAELIMAHRMDDRSSEYWTILVKSFADHWTSSELIICNAGKLAKEMRF
jgi:hypothetical protein